MPLKEIQGVKIEGEMSPAYKKILSPEACAFLADLHRRFNPERVALLAQREERQKRLNRGEKPDFLPETAAIRKDPSWKVASTPHDLERRWVEITGPAERKMVINAMNSGADLFMADFEDAHSPTWKNMVEGQINLFDTVRGNISFNSPEGKQYTLQEKRAVLLIRPRGWHLNEKHFLVDGEEISGSLFDFGLYFFHNVLALLERRTGPYFYLPKLESHLEARLWNAVFVCAQESLNIPRGTIRATVLIETILAAFEMEEILYELREHSSGLNAGRWDYLFSIIKKFCHWPSLKLPDRDQITMSVPFMRAYSALLVKTCHRRGAHAMGGMAAFVPNRKNPQTTEQALKKVREDKLRETKEGFDGTWVAHPDLVAVAREVFASALSGKPNQKERLREDVQVSAKELLDFAIPGSGVTEGGLRRNLNVPLQYLSAWLSGRGAVAIFDLMEDAATAEISRSQVWHWLHSHIKLVDGRIVTKELVSTLLQEEKETLLDPFGTLDRAQNLFERLIFSERFVEFLTLPAYEELE